MTWRNRIVGVGEEAPDQLQANPLNWRLHPKHQQEALTGILDDVGWVQQVIVNRRTGNLIDGHLRVMLALRQNAASVPVLYVDLSPEEESLILATLDPIAALASPDAQKLDELLREVGTDSPAVQTMLDKLAEKAGIVLDESSGAKIPIDDVPEQWLVLIECDDEAAQVALLDRLSGEGYRCRALTS